MRDTDDEKNALCPVVHFSGSIAHILDLCLAGVTGLNARMADPEMQRLERPVAAEPDPRCRQALRHPRVADAFTSILTNIGPATANLERRVQRSA